MCLYTGLHEEMTEGCLTTCPNVFQNIVHKNPFLSSRHSGCKSKQRRQPSGYTPEDADPEVIKSASWESVVVLDTMVSWRNFAGLFNVREFVSRERVDYQDEAFKELLQGNNAIVRYRHACMKKTMEIGATDDNVGVERKNIVAVNNWLLSEIKRFVGELRQRFEATSCNARFRSGVQCRPVSAHYTWS